MDCKCRPYHLAVLAFMKRVLELNYSCPIGQTQHPQITAAAFQTGNIIRAKILINSRRFSKLLTFEHRFSVSQT